MLWYILGSVGTSESDDVQTSSAAAPRVQHPLDLDAQGRVEALRVELVREAIRQVTAPRMN